MWLLWAMKSGRETKDLWFASMPTFKITEFILHNKSNNQSIPLIKCRQQAFLNLPFLTKSNLSVNFWKQNGDLGYAWEQHDYFSGMEKKKHPITCNVPRVSNWLGIFIFYSVVETWRPWLSTTKGRTEEAVAIGSTSSETWWGCLVASCIDYAWWMQTDCLWEFSCSMNCNHFFLWKYGSFVSCSVVFFSHRSQYGTNRE